TLLLVVSLLVVLVVPLVGIDTLRDNAWRGILWHKNSLGAVAAFCLLTWMAAVLSGKTDFRVGMLGLLFAMTMLVMSKSGTALGSCGSAIAIYFLTDRRGALGKHTLLIAILGLSCIALSGLLVFFVYFGRLPSTASLATPLAFVLGRSPDLTGRADLWQYVM